MLNDQPLLNAIPACLGFKDLNSTYIAGNQKLADILGYTHPEDLQGIKDSEIKSPIAELAETFVEQDKLVISGVEQDNLDVGLYADNQVHIFHSKKSQYRNAQSEVIGTVFHMAELSLDILQSLNQTFQTDYMEKRHNISMLNGSFKVVKDNTTDYKLSIRESECLFFLLRGQSSKEIGSQLGISYRTVETHLNSIKRKFHCKKRSQVIDKAISAGYLFNIPFTLSTTA